MFNKKLNILGVGEIVLDIICVNDEIYNYTGGGSVSNVLANLSNTNHNLIAYGSVGNDRSGLHAIKSLEQLGIDTSLLLVKKGRSRKIYQNIIIVNNIYKKNNNKITCPKCKTNLWNAGLKLKNSFIDDFKEKKIDIAVFDSIKENTLKVANVLKPKGTKLFLDIGHVGNMHYMNIERLKEHLILPFDVVQINGVVASFIKTRLKLKDDEKLFETLNTELLIITRKEMGSTIISKEKKDIKSSLIKFEVSDIKDTTGAGDAFFAGIILAYINSNNINQFIINAKKETKKIVSKVLQSIGARGHLEEKISNDLFSDLNVCQLCGSNNKVKKAKQTKKTRMQTTIDNLKKRLDYSQNTHFEEKLLNIIDKIKGNVLIIGTGASFTTSLFIKECLNKYSDHIRAFALRPREIFNEKLNDISYVFLCSYSGKSPDILSVRKYIKKTNPKLKIIIITQMIEAEFDNNDYILSYGNKNSTRERGFIAVASIIIPAYYFSKIFFNKKEAYYEKIINMLVTAEQEAIDLEFKLKQVINHKKIIIVDVFYDNFNYVIASDIESKFIESSAGRVTLHEKKDFSHGRYMTIEKNCSNIQIYIQNKNSKYENILIEYLKNMNCLDILYLNSKEKDVIIQLFELLIKNQYLFNAIGKVLNTDLSGLQFNKKALNIYKYRGD